MHEVNKRVRQGIPARANARNKRLPFVVMVNTKMVANAITCPAVCIVAASAGLWSAISMNKNIEATILIEKKILITRNT